MIETTPLARWGRLIARNHRRVLAIWAVAMLGALALLPVFFAHVKGVGFTTSGTGSSHAEQVLRKHSGVAERAPLVVHVRSTKLLAPAVARVNRLARSTGGVKAVLPAVIGRTGRTAVLTVLMTGDEASRQKTAKRIQDHVDAAAGPGATANITGNSSVFEDLIAVEQKDLVKAEAVGLPIAALILLLAFGTAVAAGLPLLVALAGLLTTFGVFGALSTLHPFTSFLETMVVMVGLGVGIDYALLIVRRFREERGQHDDVEAVARTMATAGRTVIFSGATVVISMTSLLLVRQSFFNEVAAGTTLVVALMVTAALTLVPACVVTLGDRIERLAIPHRAGSGERWGQWARFVMRRPWPVLLVALLLLGAMAAPALDMKTGIDLGIRAYSDRPSAQGLATLQRAFPGSALSSVDVVVTGRSPAATADAARALLAADRRVARVQTIAVDPTTVLVSGTPSVAPDSSAAEHLVRDVRRDLATRTDTGVRAYVGGPIAEAADFSQQLRNGLPRVVAAALSLCFLVLLAVFRSPLLAVKAVVANLLSIAASFGLVVLVFQNGGGESILAFTSPGYLQTYVPLALFVLVYGLSMDYEVFIVSRIREEYERTGDTTEAIAAGLAKTGGVVTSAAAIMVAVFMSFTLTRIPEIKQFGFGMAVAIAIDATIVRAALVPSFMRIAGRWNWWAPRWLRRPRLVFARART